MTRYYIKNAFLQRICCGDVMVSRKKVIIFLSVMALLSCFFMMFVLFTITKQIIYSDNRYMERLREHGSHYKDKLVDKSSVYLKPLQDKFNDHLNRNQYDQNIKDAYQIAHRAVASNVETIRGKADTVIKQVKQDPQKYVVDTGKQVAGYMQDTGQKVVGTLQEAGRQSLDTLQEAGKQSVDKIQEVHKDTRELINDMRDNPDKYADKAKQQYKETKTKVGVHVDRAMNGVKDSAAVLQQKAAEGYR